MTTCVARQIALDLTNIWDLRLARMSESVFSQAFEFGMRNKRTRCIKDYRCPMFPGPLLLNKFAESVELEVSGYDAAYLAAERRA